MSLSKVFSQHRNYLLNKQALSVELDRKAISFFPSDKDLINSYKEDLFVFW